MITASSSDSSRIGSGSSSESRISIAALEDPATLTVVLVVRIDDLGAALDAPETRGLTIVPTQIPRAPKLVRVVRDEGDGRRVERSVQ